MISPLTNPQLQFRLKIEVNTCDVGMFISITLTPRAMLLEAQASASKAEVSSRRLSLGRGSAPGRADATLHRHCTGIARGNSTGTSLVNFAMQC